MEEQPKTQQKAIWQQERDQLKADLARKKTVIEKREIPIRLNTTPRNSELRPKDHKATSTTDDILRRQLGFS